MNLTHRLICLSLVLTAPLAYAQQTITLRGSDSMLMLGQRWSERLQRIFASSHILVNGGGTAAALQSLSARSATIVQQPRSLTSRERELFASKTGSAALEFPVGIESVVFVVNPSNPVPNLTLAELKGIFSGRIDNWKEVGGPNLRIQLYSTENFVGGALFVREALLGGDEFDTTMRGYSNARQMAEAVAVDRGGIGFGPLVAGVKVKGVPVRRGANFPAVEPTSENLRSDRYPLSRYLYWSVPQPLGENTKKLCNWVLSAEGQLIVESLGYFPLNSADRSKGTGQLPR